LDTSPIFFHTVPTLVEALAITYGEIFQAPALEDVLLPKPFLDFAFYGVIRWKSPVSGMFFSVFQTRESPRGSSWGCTVGRVGSRNGFRSGTSSNARAWKISSYFMTSARTSLETVETQRTDVQRYQSAFLVSTYLHSRKRGNLTFRLPVVEYIRSCGVQGQRGIIKRLKFMSFTSNRQRGSGDRIM
jgi:hypothetical protein